MQRNIFLSVLLFITVLLFTGCTSAGYDSEIILNDASTAEISAEYSNAQNSSSGEEMQSQNQVKAAEEKIVIYVCGAVANPGVYELPAGSRANDALIAAGGFAKEADDSFVNLAAPVSDGSRLFIPTVEETQSGCVKADDGFCGEGNGLESTGDGLIDINRASKEELKTLPGIGDGIAGKIIDYREKNGKFDAIEDIMKVSGIKEKLFSKIKEYITV